MFQKTLLVFLVATLGTLFMGCPQSTNEPIIVRKVPPPASNPHALKVNDANKAMMLEAKLKKMRERMVSHEERVCTQDSDCTLINQDCCGCSAGGSKVGVAKAKKLDVGTRRTAMCEKVACPSVMSNHASCNATEAVCINKRCEVKAAASKAGVKTEPIP